MKRCSTCGSLKAEEEFINEKGKELKNCKKCLIRMKERYVEKREKILLYQKAYAKENKEKINIYKKEYYIKNRENKVTEIKEYYVKNKEKILEQQKTYYESKKEELCAKKRVYYSQNKESLLKKNKIYRDKNKKRIQDRKKEKYKRDKIKLQSKYKKYYEQNKEDILERSKTYRKENKEAIQRRKKLYREKYSKKIREDKKAYYEQNKDRCDENSRNNRSLRAKYKTYQGKLTIDESPKIGDNGVLLVKCFRCGEYFIPTKGEVQGRVQALLGNSLGEKHLYCSKMCKDSCPVYRAMGGKYRKIKSPKNFRLPKWAKLVKERDEYTCQKCGSKENLQAHHVRPVATHPELSEDVDNGLTLCKKCHSEAHNQEGCGLVYLRTHKSKKC